MKYCDLTLHDIYFTNIFMFLGGAIAFIYFALVPGRSELVHCERGVSCSAAIVIAYLIRFWNKARHDAFLCVKGKWTMTNPNPGFWDHLRAFKSSVVRVTLLTLPAKALKGRF